MEDINHIWSIILCAKSNGKETLTICNCFDNEMTANNLCDRINGIIEQASNTSYFAKVCRRETDAEELGTIKYVSDYDVEHVFKIIRYVDCIKLKGMTFQADAEFTSPRRSTLKTIETFLTTMYNTIYIPDNVSYERKDGLFGQLADDFVNGMLNNNPGIKTHVVYMNKNEEPRDDSVTIKP